MNAKELRDMSIEELNARETELRESYFKLRFQHGTRQLENTAGIGKVRKDIARVKTVISERESAGE